MWITSFSSPPVAPHSGIGEHFAPTPSFENQTLRQYLRVSAGGSALRVRFSNAYGKAPLELGPARIVILDDEGREIEETSRWLTFLGEPGTLIPTGANLACDVVGLKVPALSKVAVSIYLPRSTGPFTGNIDAYDALEISEPGDFTAGPFKPVQVRPERAFINAVEVHADDAVGTVAVLGDSITAGGGSTIGADRRWTDFLARRLAVHPPVWGVANLGVSGNRLVNGGFGDSAAARLDRDVAGLPGVHTLVLAIGLNDIAYSSSNLLDFLAAAVDHGPKDVLTGPLLVTAYRQVIARARQYGLRVIGCTITPFRKQASWNEEVEEIRVRLNDFIRSTDELDGVLDFDMVARCPHEPDVMREAYHMGDYLHGNDVAYEAFADSVDLALFKV